MKTRYIASVLIRNMKSEYLFIKQDKPGGAYPGTLHIPGGGIEFGETPGEAAVREVREEVGIQIEELQPVDFEWDLVNYKGEKTILVFLRFTAVLLSGEATASSDAKEVLWVPREELSNYSHNPPSLRLLAKLELL